MEITLTKVPLDEKPTLARLLEFYCYDFSPMMGLDLDDSGCFGYPYFDHYWKEPNRYPFFIKADGKLAGFVLVNQISKLQEDFTGHSIAEFFIMRKYRRQNIGRYAAHHTFDQFPGEWEVATLTSNQNAKVFWGEVILDYQPKDYRFIDNEIKQISRRIFSFNNTK